MYRERTKAAGKRRSLASSGAAGKPRHTRLTGRDGRSVREDTGGFRILVRCHRGILREWILIERRVPHWRARAAVLVEPALARSGMRRRQRQSCGFTSEQSGVARFSSFAWQRLLKNAAIGISIASG